MADGSYAPVAQSEDATAVPAPVLLDTPEHRRKRLKFMLRYVTKIIREIPNCLTHLMCWAHLCVLLASCLPLPLYSAVIGEFICTTTFVFTAVAAAVNMKRTYPADSSINIFPIALATGFAAIANIYGFAEVRFKLQAQCDNLHRLNFLCAFLCVLTLFDSHHSNFHFFARKRVVRCALFNLPFLCTQLELCRSRAHISIRQSHLACGYRGRWTRSRRCFSWSRSCSAR